MAFFDAIEWVPEDPILSLPILFKKDPNPHKVNLGIGVYLDSEGKPYVLESVREAEKQILQEGLSKEYLPIQGQAEYIQETLKLVFGEKSPILAEERVFGAQTVGGTSALRVGSEFLRQNCSKEISVSNPSWPNHKQIFSRAGLQVSEYTYYDSTRHEIDFEGLCTSLKALPKSGVVLLQASCHNPTGRDLNQTQWLELSKVMKTQRLIPFFDLAYQGFGKDLDEDAKPIRTFVEQGHELLVSTSFSKNFGLYGERAGTLSIVANSKETAQKIGSQIRQNIRSNFSNPPLHPAQIISKILTQPELKASWQKELDNMHSRVKEMREALAFGLMSKSLHKDYDFITEQTGLFSFTDLTSEQVRRLREEKGIHMLGNGRINIAGINPHNLQYVVDSIVTISGS